MSLTNCEVEFYTRMPKLLANLVEEVKKLTKEVNELKEKLNEKPIE